MSAHAMQLVEANEGVGVRCECGWHLDTISSVDVAEERWRIHVIGCRAASSMTSSLRTLAATCQRRLELEQLQATMRHRRNALAERRRQFYVDQLHARSPAITTPRCTGAIFDRALSMSGRTTQDLWLAYFSIGGCLELHEVQEIVAGVRPVGPLDHDLLALALNDWFDDAGFGRPVDHWQPAVRTGRR